MPKKLKSKPTLEGEHIFPATQLTPLAVKWKDLHSAGRHKEAMAVLEEIVVGSTAMFERLAMYEDFHYTVDLGVLVGEVAHGLGAAQRPPLYLVFKMREERLPQ